MKSFISGIASALYDRYGDEISSLTMVFPSRRARLFFSSAISVIADRPVWQPHTSSVDELMEQISGVSTANHIKLVTELYKVYSKYHIESFDQFYFWGETLLSDFDQIDKYLIDARTLFTNVSDLHNLSDNFSYLTPEQIAVITRFWRNFGLEGNFSKEKEQFLNIWRSLNAIYDEFNESLTTQGLAYEGMVQRIALNRLASSEPLGIEPKKYIIAGFNALSECEKRLFDYLQKSGQAEFIWDYDSYYVANQESEAGLFLRENIRRYPQRIKMQNDTFIEPKNIITIASPSDTLQCKYVHTFLRELLSRGIMPNKETAIVLTDETLLNGVLYSIPEEISEVNVTMGYPLRQTIAYSFMEHLIELQNRKRIRKTASLFYHSDVTALLAHPYIVDQNEQKTNNIISAIQRNGRVYIPADMFVVDSTVEQIFRPVTQWTELAQYLREILSLVGQNIGSADDFGRRREFLSLMIDTICEIENSLIQSNLEITTPIFTSLLRKVLQGIRIPYEGEPLSGVQIMGILETRNLDFENVLVLSVNDDTFPGNRATTTSFIPHNIRFAYGLPTPAHHEGVYAYYFYRLLQRAKNVHLAYCARGDEKHSGEPSRYIYQLTYESPHAIIQRSIPLNINMAQESALVIPKTGETAVKLADFIKENGRTLSPTSFYRYLECPMKFYLTSIASLKTENEVSEEIDLPMFGTILHRAMETLYTPLIDNAATAHNIARLINSKSVEAAVDKAINSEYLRETNQIEADDYSGDIILVRDIVIKYINRCILPFDAGNDFIIKSLEKEVSFKFSFTVNDQIQNVTFKGKADRIDLLPSGIMRVVDYKTGSQHSQFYDFESLFGQNPVKRNSAVLQTLLYSLMISESEHCDVQPALYYIRFMNNKDFSPLLIDGKTAVDNFAAYKTALEEKIQQLMSELFDLTKPFIQCNDKIVCEYCDFKDICRR